MPRVVHFEIHATRPPELITFYSGLFGWRFQAWGPPGQYWLVETSPDSLESVRPPGINGGLVKRRGDAPTEGQAVNAFVCTVDVDSTADYMERAQALGGTVAVPRMPIPGVGWLGYVKDPDGNIIGMMQSDSSAA